MKTINRRMKTINVEIPKPGTNVYFVSGYIHICRVVSVTVYENRITIETPFNLCAVLGRDVFATFAEAKEHL